jgi:hypothetical protein
MDSDRRTVGEQTWINILVLLVVYESIKTGSVSTNISCTSGFCLVRNHKFHQEDLSRLSVNIDHSHQKVSGRYIR